jgi:hypothetical protein
MHCPIHSKSSRKRGKERDKLKPSLPTCTLQVKQNSVTCCLELIGEYACTNQNAEYKTIQVETATPPPDQKGAFVHPVTHFYWAVHLTRNSNMKFENITASCSHHSSANARAWRIFPALSLRGRSNFSTPSGPK